MRTLRAQRCDRSFARAASASAARSRRRRRDARNTARRRCQSIGSCSPRRAAADACAARAGTRRAEVRRRGHESRHRRAHGFERIECRHDPAPRGAGVAPRLVTIEVPKMADSKIDDQFLRDLKAQPSPEFAGRLRATLRALPPNAVTRVAPAAAVKRWFAAAASIAVVGVVFTLPPVQAAAEAFLDLFRVKQFTGVQFDPERLKDLEGSGFNPESLLGNVVEPLTPPQEPVSYATAADAGAAAGIRVRTPAFVPQGFASTGFMATSEMAARLTIDTAGLQALLDALGLADVELPQGLDGQTATVRLPPVVTQTFVSRNPEVTDRD